MNYNFQNLSPADFEDLVRDLLGKELKMRFEAFGAGPDGGIDGRHSSNGKSTILQAKHYVGSTLAHLKAVMKKEKKAIAKLKARRYLLATSRPVTAKAKGDLKRIIGRALRRTDDIFGPVDLNALLRKFPEVEKATIKLWLSSTAVLERVVRSAAYEFTAMSRADIEAKVKVYAQNPSFDGARKKLESEHVLIIMGPPGVGKTTLAEMLAYAYIGDEWEFIAIRSLDDGFSRVVDTKKQIFFFDDFLGRAALDANALATKDTDLARFIRRVRMSPNARFILTTRAPIFEEARKISEHLADDRLDITRYLIDVGIYTRRIRARILYNHLVVAKTSDAYIADLMKPGILAKIIDHKNYNPRIIEAMTDQLRLRDIKPDEYGAAIIAALNDPRQVWDLAFRKHITPPCRHLLYALFFASEYGVALDDLKKAYNALHPVLCNRFGHAHDPKDFEDSVKILEGGFISIYGTRVSFINPSLRDYLMWHLDEIGLLLLFAEAPQTVDWAAALWRHVRTNAGFKPEDHLKLAKCFLSFRDKMRSLPTMKRELGTNYSTPSDMSMASRLELLLEWEEVVGDGRFAETALEIATKPAHSYWVWRDGRTLVALAAGLRRGEHADLAHRREELIEQIEQSIVDELKNGLVADDLDTMASAIDLYEDDLGPEVIEAMQQTIAAEIENVMETAESIDSESTLDDHAKTLQRFGEKIGIPSERIERAVRTIGERIAEVRSEATAASAPEVGKPLRVERDSFSDEAMRGLFLSLMQH